MKTEAQFIKEIATTYAMTTPKAGKREADLAVYILKNFYGVDTFFPNVEGDFNSGINLSSLEVFRTQMSKVMQAIEG
jgi:hypothetical protein